MKPEYKTILDGWWEKWNEEFNNPDPPVTPEQFDEAMREFMYRARKPRSNEKTIKYKISVALDLFKEAVVLSTEDAVNGFETDSDCNIYRMYRKLENTFRSKIS